MERIHQEVLDAANRLVASRPDHSFSPAEIVALLRHRNENTVRTHVVSRCCINAPNNHPHKWPYFRRVGRGRYQVAQKFLRAPAMKTASRRAQGAGGGGTPVRDTIHAIIHKDGDTYVAECLELAVVTQGATFDETLANLREAMGLHLEGEDLSALGIAPNPRLQITYELPAAI